MNRTLRRALARLEALPPDLLADAIEKLIDRLDELDAPTYDLEAGSDDDACEAEDIPQHGGVLPAAGDADDAEDDDPGGTGCEDEGPLLPIVNRAVDYQVRRLMEGRASGYYREGEQ